MQYNHTVVVGNLTRDPESRSFGENSVTSFSLAVSKRFGDKEKTLFLDCKAWNRTGEVITQYCSKGSNILVEGELETEQWDAKDGTKRSKIVLNVRNMQLGPKRNDQPHAGGNSQPRSQQPANDDIPF